MSKKILIIDDEKDILESVKAGLEESNEDLEVIGIENGKKCLDYLTSSEEKPDLIVLDIMMPGIDGWQLLNRIKENNNLKNIPIVFLTAKDDEFTVTFAKSQAEDFIEKPFDIDDLKKRLFNILNKYDKNYMSIK